MCLHVDFLGPDAGNARCFHRDVCFLQDQRAAPNTGVRNSTQGDVSAAPGRSHHAFSNSTSNTSVALGGITPPAPRAP